MKDYLKRLARGIFRYDDAQIIIDKNEIKAEVPEDSVMSLSFSYSAGQAVKGVIWSSNDRVTINDNMFSGTEGTIEYQVDCTGMYNGDTLTGTFDVVSSAGEYQITYEFGCVLKSLETSIGQAATLYDFTNLAQKAPEEAERIYIDDRFKKTFLRGDDTLKCLYDMFSMNTNEAEAIEEFLVSAHQKEPVKLSIDSTLNQCDVSEDETGYSLMINKSTWGYTDISVKAQPSFVTVDNESEFLTADGDISRKMLTTEDFTGSMCELGYMVKRDRLHAGINYGRISLSTFNQMLKHDVTAVCVVDDAEAESVNPYRQHRTIIMDITRCYLSYRMKKISSGEWIETTNKLIEKLRGYGTDTPYYKLIQAQVMIAMGQADECEWLLESARSDINTDNVVLYCYYLYVSSLAKKDATYTAQACDIIRKYYENSCDDWRVLWFLFYIDKQFNHNQSVKLIRIKDAYQAGCNSPVMYFEALHILNTQPVLLRVLNRFELQAIIYGCRNGIIEESLAKHIAELIGSERVASFKMISIMNYIYKQYETDENLNVLCSQMIRNGMYGKECLAIYEKAILRGLRITRLYEYYIKSISRDRYVRLPKIVLMFFAYDSGLDYTDKAYLYADIITNESENHEVYDSYRPHIEQFGYEQLKLGNVDDNLLVIYRHIWDAKLIDPSTAPNILKLMFTYRIRVYSGNMENVLVKHKELKKVERYSIKDGLAYIPMYTKGSSLVFEDNNGHLHKDTIDYEKEKVLDDTSLLNNIIELKIDNEYFNFYRFEAGHAIEQDNQAMIDNALALSRLNGVEEDELSVLNSWIIGYYNEFFEGDDFAEHLKNIRKENLCIDDAVRLTEVCIRNDQFADAKELIEQYGYSRISANLLFRYVRHQLECLNDMPDESLIGISYHVFAAKKYNEEVLGFMSDYFNGNNEQMYELWKACENFKVDCVRLEERLIAQALFTGEHNGRLTEVFTSYYAKGGNKLIIDAYIAYNSFLYFVKNKKANDIVFTAICDRLDSERDIQDICKLALLKHWSTRVSELSDRQIGVASKLIGELCKENKCFEFFKKFSHVLALPYNILDQTIVEYYGNPEAKVSVHYRFGSEDKEHTELMTVCGGVFVKSFTCFYGENLTYYFIEEYKNKVVQSQVYNITCNTINTEGNNGRFDYINDMLASRELHDIATMRKLMHGYCVQNYVMEQYFKPL